jgi:FkbM family methyltransferase
VSGAKVFLDVGAHTGETLRAVVDDRYRFDRIVCFEPASWCIERLARFRHPRLEIAPFGLWKESERRILHDPGTVGASIFEEKRRSDKTQEAEFVRASDWFAENIEADDTVFLKLNCEGAECDILEDLLDSGEIRKADFILVHFDVRKVPSQRHRERQVKARLRDEGVENWAEADEVLVGPSMIARIQHWLDSVGADEYSKLGPGGRIRSSLNHLRFARAPAFVQRAGLGRMARKVLPHALYGRFQAFFYPEAGDDR